MFARNSDFWRVASSARCLARYRRSSFSCRARRWPRQLVGAAADLALLVAQFGGLALEQAVLLLDLFGARADLVLEQFLLAPQAVHAHPEDAVAEAQHQQAAQRAEPPGLPVRRQHRDLQAGGESLQTPSLLAARTWKV
jgi:hypothetical protein